MYAQFFFAYTNKIFCIHTQNLFIENWFRLSFTGRRLFFLFLTTKRDSKCPCRLGNAVSGKDSKENRRKTA